MKRKYSDSPVSTTGPSPKHINSTPLIISPHIPKCQEAIEVFWHFSLKNSAIEKLMIRLLLPGGK